jgi:hypothetical protein
LARGCHAQGICVVKARLQGVALSLIGPRIGLRIPDLRCPYQAERRARPPAAARVSSGTRRRSAPGREEGPQQVRALTRQQP